MKRWVVFTVLVTGLSVLVSGLVRPEGAQAYSVHARIAQYAREVWSNAEIAAYAPVIDRGADDEDEHDHVWNIGWPCTTVPHFWDADDGDDDPVEIETCTDPNAWQKAQVLWGMAVGEYHSGDLGDAYHYLGHVSHLLGDVTVPAHAHEDGHKYGDTFDNDFMNSDNNELLTEAEPAAVKAAGPVEIPDGVGELDYLFYTAQQVGDFYASDHIDGDSADPKAWVDFSGLEDVPACRLADELEEHCDLHVIRRNVYFYSIRAVAALYRLFEENTDQQTDLTLVIDSVQDLQGHGEDPDYYVRVGIGGHWFRNEGNQEENVCEGCTVNPGWAFGQNVGLTGTTEVKIELWDADYPDAADQSDIHTDPDGEDRALWLTVDLEKCAAGVDGAVSGDLGGTCGVQLTSAGDDEDRSQIWFRILAPNVPPTAEAGSDQTVQEADLVTLNGSFTDPNVDDTHRFLWHLESSSGVNCVNVWDAATQTLTFTPIDDCVYSFSFTVTDSHGAQGSDTVVVTAENVPPVASIDSLTDETGAEIGADVAVALAGLEVGLAGSFSDVGIVDTHTASIDWGDGVVSLQADLDSFSDCLGGTTGALTRTHVYDVPGSYTITLNVTDDDAGVGTASRQIDVVDAAGAIEAVIENLTAPADDRDVQAAIDKLRGEQGGDAANGALDMLNQGNPNAALEKIKQALEYLEAAEAADPSLDLTHEKGLLALAGKSVAVGGIEDAEAVAVKPTDLVKIQDAKDLVALGDGLLATHDYVGSVNAYQQAVSNVQTIH